MFGLTTSQSIASVLLVVFIVFYFAANSGSKQNAFIYMFAIALVVLIVGKYFIKQIVYSWMIVLSTTNPNTKTGRRNKLIIELNVFV